MVREGTDVTIFCYSRMRYVVMQVRPLAVQGWVGGGKGKSLGSSLAGLAGRQWAAVVLDAPGLGSPAVLGCTA